LIQGCKKEIKISTGDKTDANGKPIKYALKTQINHQVAIFVFSVLRHPKGGKTINVRGFLSTKGAESNSIGQRPMYMVNNYKSALKGRKLTPFQGLKKTVLSVIFTMQMATN